MIIFLEIKVLIHLKIDSVYKKEVHDKPGVPCLTHRLTAQDHICVLWNERADGDTALACNHVLGLEDCTGGGQRRQTPCALQILSPQVHLKTRP